MSDRLYPSEDKPFARCMLCRGPIWSGNPAKVYSDDGRVGWIHYFKSTCAQCCADDRETESIVIAEIAYMQKSLIPVGSND